MHRWSLGLTGVALAALLATGASGSSGDAARAWRNLRLVLNGSAGFGALSSDERAEVLEAARQMRKQQETAGLTAFEKCRLANLSAAVPTPLEEAAIRLKCSQR